MAYPINANDVCLVTIRGVLLDQVVMTTLAYRHAPGSVVITNGAAFLDDMFANLDQAGDVLEDLVGALPGNMGEILVDLQWVYPIRYRKKTYTPTINLGQGSDTTISNIAAVITVAGEQASRRTIANKHIPISQLDVEAGQLTAGYAAVLEAYKTQILADLLPVAGHPMEPIIWGPPKAAYTKCGKDYPALPALRTDIVTAVIQDTSRVMRRRTLRLGV